MLMKDCDGAKSVSKIIEEGGIDHSQHFKNDLP